MYLFLVLPEILIFVVLLSSELLSLSLRNKSNKHEFTIFKTVLELYLKTYKKL